MYSGTVINHGSAGLADVRTVAIDESAAARSRQTTGRSAWDEPALVTDRAECDEEPERWDGLA